MPSDWRSYHVVFIKEEVANAPKVINSLSNTLEPTPTSRIRFSDLLQMVYLAILGIHLRGMYVCTVYLVYPATQCYNCTDNLAGWLLTGPSRTDYLGIPGMGPPTRTDYLGASCVGGPLRTGATR